MKHLISIVILLCCVTPAATFAASFELEEAMPASAPSSGEARPARLGDTIRVPVYIDAGDESVSIALLRVTFSREMLWAKLFIPAPGWLTVPGEEYNVLDNGRGSVRVASGFEGGVSGRVFFGTLEFVAVGSGITDVIIETDSILLNLRNKNIATAPNTLASRIMVTSLKDLDVGNPAQLFDIRLLLERQVFSSNEPIPIRITFESFGVVPTPVDIFFTITDKSGKIFATSHESLVVETDATLSKQFEHLSLPPGEYEIRMNTRYNVNVEDGFHASFRIRREVESYYAALGAVLFAIVAGIAYFFWLRRKSPSRTQRVLKDNH